MTTGASSASHCLGCGVVVASLAVGAFRVLQAQPQPGPTINLCFGPNNDLRFVEPGVPCRPEERRVQVKQPDPKPEEELQRNSRLEALKRRLSDLRSESALPACTGKGRRAFRSGQRNKQRSSASKRRTSPSSTSRGSRARGSSPMSPGRTAGADGG
jgi:hypothetical protein